MPSQASIAKDAALLDEVDPTATLELHRSNLLRLQSNELLNECHLDITSQKWTAQAHEYLQTLAKHVHKFQLPSASTEDKASQGMMIRRADKAVQVSSLNKQDLTIEPTGWTKHMSPTAGWTKPTGNAQVLPTFTVSVLLPSSLFSSKDYMNYRYHDKRNLVLGHLVSHLKKQSKVLGDIQYQWPDGSDGAPCLKILPPPTGKKNKFQVQLRVGMESIQWVPSLRLVPNRNNVKHSNNSVSEQLFSGQRYNQALLDDVRHTFQDEELTEFQDLPKEVGHTLIFIQVWALQRGLWRNHDGIRAEAMALFVLYLLRTHQMNARMTSIQLFTVVLQAFVKTNWLGSGAADQNVGDSGVRAAYSQEGTTLASGKDLRRQVLVLPLDESTEQQTVAESSLARLYAQHTRESPLTDNDPPTLIDAYAGISSYVLGPVFLDSTMTYNYFGNVSPNYMKLLQTQAATSLKMIQSRYAFSHLFLRPVRFWDHWDMHVRIPVNKKSDGSWEESIRSLTQTLETALGNRIRGIRVLSTGNGIVERDADETACGESMQKVKANHSPTGSSFIVIGLSINPETSQRAVDRGPPAENSDEVTAFLQLWGKKAQLRRFKDGAIIQAVVWNDTPSTFSGEDRMDGGIVKKIIQHIVKLHYTTEQIDFSLPELLSAVDGIAEHGKEAALFSDPFAAQRTLMKAFESLSDFLRSNSQPPYVGSKESSRLGLPLPIDSVEPLSPSLRYSDLFPPLPHPLLGGEPAGEKKVSGAIVSNPILIQLRFGSSSKWPTDLKAMGAAKAAMLVQLINGIEELDPEGFDGPMVVSPTYADIGYKGFVFRLVVRADQEIRMLQGLQNPSPEATTLLESLTKKHSIGSSHHAIIHGVNTLHPSAGAVVRMAKRWISCHMLSSHISTELIELLVAKVYTDSESPIGSPCTVNAGFLRFLWLLASHNWARDPLVVNPRNHITEDDVDDIQSSFEHARGGSKCDGPPMFIVAPYDRVNSDDGEEPLTKKSDHKNNSRWVPNTTSPEWVVVKRAGALAKKSFHFLSGCRRNFDDDGWSSAFHETSNAFHAYNVLLRISEDFSFDPLSSSSGADLGIATDGDGRTETAFTRSARARHLGPKALRQKMYRNLRATLEAGMILEWNPIQSMVRSMQEKLGNHALFFYNELAPEVVCILWRPRLFEPTSLSIMSSDYMEPAADGDWTSDSLVKRNSSDLIREMKQFFSDFVTAVKVVERDSSDGHAVENKRGHKRKVADE